MGWVVAFALLVVGSVAVPAGAAAKPRVKVTVKPVVVAPAAMLRVSGRVSGRLRGSRRVLRVVLDERVGRRWRKRVSGRLARGARFSLGWRVPGVEGTRTLRIRLLAKRRVVAKSARWRVKVVRAVVAPVPLVPGAPGAGLPPAPAPAPGGSSPPPAAQTLIVEPGVVVSAPAAGEVGTLRLAGAVAVSVGDVLGSGIGQAAPYGFLFRATGVHAEGGDTLVEVVPATLLEAVAEGSIHETLRLESTAGRSARPFRRTIACEAGGTVTIEGSADLGAPQVDLDADWGGFPPLPRDVEVTTSVTASAEASATVSGAASCTVGPTRILDTRLAPVTFVVPIINLPVVVLPSFEVDLSGLGEVQASVATSVSASLTARAGARYEDGELSPIAELVESFDYQEPDPDGSAKLTATLSSELDLKFYGVGGPELAFNAGLELNADPEAEPWWTLDAPVSVTAGFEIDILDIEAGPITVYEHTFRLAQARARDRLAEAEVSLEVTDDGIGTSQAICDPATFEASDHSSASLRARSTRPVVLDHDADLVSFDFRHTEPELIAATFSGGDSYTCNDHSEQRTLMTPATTELNITSVSPVLVFTLPSDFSDQPDAVGFRAWDVTGSSTIVHWTGNSINEDSPFFRLSPRLAYRNDGDDGDSGVLMGWASDEPTQTTTELPGSITEQPDGTIVISGGKRLVEERDGWGSVVIGHMKVTHELRWTITVHPPT